MTKTYTFVYAKSQLKNVSYIAQIYFQRINKTFYESFHYSIIM